MHPFIVAEISLGSLRHRQRTLGALESLLEVKVAALSKVRHMIEGHDLYSKGIGLTGAHLIASCLITPRHPAGRSTPRWKIGTALEVLVKLPGFSIAVDYSSPTNAARTRPIRTRCPPAI